MFEEHRRIPMIDMRADEIARRIFSDLAGDYARLSGDHTVETIADHAQHFPHDWCDHDRAICYAPGAVDDR